MNYTTRETDFCQELNGKCIDSLVKYAQYTDFNQTNRTLALPTINMTANDGIKVQSLFNYTTGGHQVTLYSQSVTDMLLKY